VTLPLNLPIDIAEHPAMDYAFLRSEGIRILERLGGQLWTDFNAHDPGITILEQVCYALTDLTYRIDYDIKDLLASGAEDPYRSLHSPAQVLTINPVTVTDLRKLALDVPGVKNAWFEPIENAESELVYDPSEACLYLKTSDPQPPHREAVSLRGIYRVLLEADNNLGFHAADILPEVNRRLYANRGLGEDFLPPAILPGQGVIVNTVIEVGAVDDPELLLAEVYYALANFISPRIRFYSLSEMLDRGKRIDEIMDGPSLQHGFIDDAELGRLERKTGLRTSDLIQEILNIEGAVTVNSINISDGVRSEAWYLKLDPLRTPFLDVDKSLFASDGPTIRLVRGGIEVQAKPARVGEILKELRQRDSYQPLPRSQRDIRLSVGSERNVSQYHSIQYQFPTTYGVGAFGLPESASAQRKALAKQLKAYLMFFDQLLANYFAQLGNAKDLFSFYAQEPRSYFSQIIDDPDLKLNEIYKRDLAAQEVKIQEITDMAALNWVAVEGDDPASAGRKNRFLNHLLARFAEQFTEYSLLLYANINEKELIENKSAFLRDYHKIGTSRGSGFNYTMPSYGTDNVSGLEKRISRKLGISTYQKRDLAAIGSDDIGGFHILEHLLLRPNLADNEQWAKAVAGTGWQAAAFMAEPLNSDPYSHQLSFIFPNWVSRFTDKGFSDLIEKTLREETAAHIRIRIHWLDQADMHAFESAYKTWLEQMIAGRMWEAADIKPDDYVNRMIRINLRDARDRMVQILGIGTPYPLRDLKLDYPPMIAYNQPASINIVGGQSGVLYQLCDEDGNLITENGNQFEVIHETGDLGDKVILQTPAIRKDITFTVLAVREDKQIGVRLETYLNQIVEIKAGIDTSLPVVFSPFENQVAGGQQVIINYGDKITVAVSGTQEGISYKLVTGPDDALVNLSNPQKGNLSTINLVSTQGFNEDMQIKVRAYRTSSSKTFANLDASLSIKVRANPAVQINVEPPIIDYNTSATLTLTASQTTAEYHLFKRELTTSDYVASEAGNLVIMTDEGRQVFVKPSEKIPDWNVPSDFTLVGTFRDNNGKMSTDSSNLLEDTLFIIRATKIENGEVLQLDQSIAVLVRPDTAPVVSVEQANVDSGTEGVVRVGGTQKGVAYQLRLDVDNTPVNPPGYDLADRGVNTTRLEVDFVVEEPGHPILMLPTDSITEQTTFNILASKIITGVSAQLDGKATLNAQAGTGG